VEKVIEIVRKQLALTPETELTNESKFAALGADSLDTVSHFLASYLGSVMSIHFIKAIQEFTT
jgi:hypothetical protein